MQKMNQYQIAVISGLLLLTFCMSARAEDALPSSASSEVEAVKAPEGASEQPVAAQEQIVRVLESDILYERERRQLMNELSLAKLRAELQKIRQDSAPVRVMPAEAPHPAASPVMPSVRPSVLFISRVAGISRVAVSVGSNAPLFTRTGEVFDVNGKKYKVVSTGGEKNHLHVEEIR